MNFSVLWKTNIDSEKSYTVFLCVKLFRTILPKCSKMPARQAHIKFAELG